jgi:hypothetical protein
MVTSICYVLTDYCVRFYIIYTISTKFPTFLLQQNRLFFDTFHRKLYTNRNNRYSEGRAVYAIKFFILRYIY